MRFFSALCAGALLVSFGTGWIAHAAGTAIAQSVRFGIGAGVVTFGIACCAVAVMERGR